MNPANAIRNALIPFSESLDPISASDDSKRTIALLLYYAMFTCPQHYEHFGCTVDLANMANGLYSLLQLSPEAIQTIFAEVKPEIERSGLLVGLEDL